MFTSSPNRGRRPATRLPAGACDCHMHLFDTRIPFAAGAVLEHGDASVDDYRRLQARLGSTRCVVVQPSAYGTDHRVLVAGLRALGGAARGVAVVTPDMAAGELETLAAQGVVGTRFNLVQRGVTNESMVGAVAERARGLGWHLQFHLLPEDLLRMSDELVGLPVPVVLDHFGRIQTEPTLEPAVRERLEQMLSTGKVWLKLSAPYLAMADGGNLEDLQDFVKRLLDRYPDRLVWGSDWPHATETVKPDDAGLLDLVVSWVPVEMRAQLFVKNPAELYSFQERPFPDR